MLCSGCLHVIDSIEARLNICINSNILFDLKGFNETFHHSHIKVAKCLNTILYRKGVVKLNPPPKKFMKAD